jgi:hypothetical protein
MVNRFGISGLVLCTGLACPPTFAEIPAEDLARYPGVARALADPRVQDFLANPDVQRKLMDPEFRNRAATDPLVQQMKDEYLKSGELPSVQTWNRSPSLAGDSAGGSEWDPSPLRADRKTVAPPTDPDLDPEPFPNPPPFHAYGYLPDPDDDDGDGTP